jgi:Carbohydrate binding module (family 6)
MNAHRDLFPAVSRLAAIALSLVALGGVAAADTLAPGATMNGLPTASTARAGSASTELQSMLLKYAARCALREDQELQGPPDATGSRPRFPGALGIAPEWRDGTCDRNCQEKVSSCLIALVNRTGKHVQLSLLSAAPGMVQSAKSLMAGETDLGFPHQEGAFFGNVFSGEGYACRGSEAGKGAQVKRFCALEPESCTGLVEFSDAGRCEDVCEMSCVALSDGSQRCAAAACTDPQGHRWASPITTYLRNQIEAGNADALDGTRAAKDEGLEPRSRLAAARYENIDFGTAASNVKTFTARVAALRPGARIEVWLDGRKRLGVLSVKRTGGADQDQSALIDASGISGPHAVVLKLVDATRIARLSTIEFK